MMGYHKRKKFLYLAKDVIQMKLKNKLIVKGVILISIASVLWGLDGVVFTPRLSNLNVVFVVFVLHALPFLLMNLFFYKRYKDLHKFTRVTFLSLIAVSLFGGVIGTIAIVKALFMVNFKHLSVVVLLQKLQPVFAIILAAIVLREKLSKHFLFWAGLAIISGHFLTFGLHLPNIDGDISNIKAALFSILAAFSFGSSTVFSKNLLNKVDFISATFFRYGMVVLLMLPVIIIGGYYKDFSQVTNTNWLFIVLISLTTGSGAILLYYYGLKYVRASISTISELFFPISAIFFDYFINGNILSPVQWISAAFMIFAIIKANLEHTNSDA